MDAVDAAAVVAILHERGHLPVRAQAMSGSSQTVREPGARGSMATLVSGRGVHLDLLAGELARLTKAGITVERSLEILVESAQDRKLSALCAKILTGIRSGASLSDTLDLIGPPFDALFVSLVRAGEAGATLPSVLAQLADYLEQMRELRSSLVSALIYPAILVSVSALSIILLLVYVVPQFRELFSGADAALPASTEIVFAVADALAAYWWAGLGAGALGAALATILLRVPAVRVALDRILLTVPVIGPLVTDAEVSRLCRTLGTLLGNGVPVLPALAIVETVCRNTAMAGVVRNLSAALEGGSAIGPALRQQPVFPSLVAHMVTIGEESGRLHEMLHDVARLKEAQVRRGLRTALALLEPALILIMGVIVGAIIISILVAILAINRLPL